MKSKLLHRFCFDDYNSRTLFLSNIALATILALGINISLITETLYYQSFEGQLAIDRIAKLIELSQKWQWLGYLFIPTVVLFRVSFTTICLYTGFFLVNVKIRFKDLFKVALLADFVFLLAGFVKLVILIFFKEVNTLNDMQFQPLSLMGLFDRKSVDTLFTYPLSLINVFELLYWLALAWLLKEVIEIPFSNSLRTVALSYGTGLLLWVLFIMFLTVNLSS